MNSATFDLIYLDPPFNSKANYAAPIGSQAAGAAFKDTWTLSDLDLEWLDLIESKHQALHRVIMASMTDSDKSYLIYMAARLLEMCRLLKPTGSIYLHCDDAASAHLKLMMDAVFGRENFQNEIVWKRTAARGDSKRFGRITDTLLFYGNQINKDAIRVPLNPDYVRRMYHHKDIRGHYQATDLTTKGLSGGGYHYDFHGHLGPWRYPEHRMLELEADNRIHLPAKVGGVPRFKRYLADNKGQVPPNLWTDIPPALGKQRTGYPTQKPLALLDRIIKASSNEGDTVFDPFCGCATTLVAADRLDRDWIGIDISPKAAELVVQRIHGDQSPLFRGIVSRTDIPQRTDLGNIPRYNCTANKTSLYGQQGGHCGHCRTHFQIQHLQVDHIIARSKGGTDHIDNLQLLCGHCNSVKGDRGMAYLRERLRLAA